MIEEWDNLWVKKPFTLDSLLVDDEGNSLQSDHSIWLERVKVVGDKLEERVVYLEGLTDGDVKIITRLQVENKQLRRDTKDLAELGSDDLKKRVAYQKENEALKIVTAKLFNKLADEQQKLEAIREIAEPYRNHCIKAVDKILEALGVLKEMQKEEQV